MTLPTKTSEHVNDQGLRVLVACEFLGAVRRAYTACRRDQIDGRNAAGLTRELRKRWRCSGAGKWRGSARHDGP